MGRNERRVEAFAAEAAGGHRHGEASWRWLAALLFALSYGASTQTVYTFPASVAVTQVQTQMVTLLLAQTGTAAGLEVLTAGAPNLDYALAAGGSCATGTAYAAGQTCTAAINFSPRFPGGRHGAVVLMDSGGSTLAATYLEGTGTGSQSVLTPGLVSTVAGDAQWIYSGDNHLATQSAIFLPMGEVTDAAGNLYVADTSNNRVRRVDAVTGIITTVAGSGNSGYGGDSGPGVNAQLNGPTALAMDGAGNLFIADSGNYVVRMLSTISGVITTIAGAGGAAGAPGDGGPATMAHLSAVGGLALDTQHRLYLADTGNNTIRRVDLTSGVITRFAGQYGAGYAGDGGAALGALFNTPQGMNFGPDGSLFVADLNNNVIREIDASGVVTTAAGGGTNPNSEGIAARLAQLILPAGVAVDQAGNLYIADAGSNRIRKVTAATGLLRTIAGNGSEQFAGDGGNADLAQFYGPYSIFYDGEGNLFIGDMFHNRIREVNGSLAALKYSPIRVNRTSAPQIEKLENDGNDVLTLAAPVFANASLDPATTTCILPGPMAQGVSCALGVAFSPTVLGNPVAGSVTVPSDAGNSPAVIGVTGQSLLVDPTAVTLASNLNPAGFGLPVTFTAHVTTQGTTLTGSVQFLDGTTVLGTGAMNGAHTATFTTSSLAPGPHTMTAFYLGDATNATSTSAPLVESVKQQTVVTLQSSANPSFESEAITLTAVVTGHGSVPTGQIMFASDGSTLATVPLDGFGIATYTISTLTIGQHALTASYNGDATNSGSQSNTVGQIVQGQSSTTVLNASSLSIAVGTSVAFSAQVTGSNTTVASGTVTFRDGSTTLGTATLDATGAGGLSTAALAPGQHTVTAVYAGDANYASSTSAALVETVQQIATAATVTASVNPAPAGAGVVLSAAVGVVSGTATGGAIAGTVTFLNGTAVLGTGALSATGIATIQVATLPLGPNSVTVRYPGSVNYLASTSPVLVETIVQATTATALATSQTPSVAEDAITLTATVMGNGGAATGTVTFMDGAATLGTGTLNTQGVATFTTAALTVGLHPLTAGYGGDMLNLPSASTSLGQTIVLRPTADVLTSSATSLTGGQQVTLISVVQWTGALVPTGSAVFQAGGTTLGTAPVDGTGVATLTINPQIGLTNVVATYSGDATYAGSSSPTVAISVGQPALFTISADNAAMTLQRLQHGTVNVTVASVNGFADSFKLGCLGLPLAATCTFSADQMTLASGGGNTVQVVVDTGSPLTAGSVARVETRSSGGLLALCGLPIGVLCLVFRRRPRGAGARLLLALCALGMTAALSGCGTLTINGTPPGTYHFQITAAAQGANVIEAVNMTLTVTP